MAQKKKVYVNKQIAIFQTGSYLIELVDNLKPALKYFTGHIHARADKYVDEDGNESKEESSLIRVVMVDYSEREKEKDEEKAKKIPTVQVYMNLEPERIRWYFSAVSRGVVEYRDYAEKIFGDPDETGYSKMTKIAVCRNEVYNGIKQNRPWYICVENGKGIKVKLKSGACYCQKDSYVKEKEVSARLTDYEFFSLMSQGVQYLDAIESRYILEPMMTGLLNKLFLAVKGCLAKMLNIKPNVAVDAEPQQTETQNLSQDSSVKMNIEESTGNVKGKADSSQPDLPFFSNVGMNASVPGNQAIQQVTQNVPKQNMAAEPNAKQPAAQRKMSYEEASKVVITFGPNKGKTMGTVAMENPSQLWWFVNSYNGKKTELKMAAAVLLESVKAA